MVKYTEQQPYNDPMCFDEWKHFSIQIQQEEVFGVQQSSLMVVELIVSDPDTAAPRLMGRDTIKLQEILKKVCKLDTELLFTHGSHTSNVIIPSTLPQVDIPSLMQQDTPGDTQCRISAGLMDCIQRRGRLLQLHKSLEECKTGKDRVQFLENLILRKSLGTSSPCRENESSEVLSKEEEQKRNEEDKDDGTREERPRIGKTKYKPRK